MQKQFVIWIWVLSLSCIVVCAAKVHAQTVIMSGSSPTPSPVHVDNEDEADYTGTYLDQRGRDETTKVRWAWSLASVTYQIADPVVILTWTSSAVVDHDEIDYTCSSSGTAYCVLRIVGVTTHAPQLFGKFNFPGTFTTALQADVTPSPPTSPTTKTEDPGVQHTVTADVKITRQEKTNGASYPPYLSLDHASFFNDRKKLRDALPGQCIDLRAEMPMPPNTAATYSWTLDGKIFNSWSADATQSVLSGEDKVVKNEVNTKFHWIDSGQKSIQVTIAIGQKSFTGNETINVEKPVVSLSISTGRVWKSGAAPEGGIRLLPNPDGTPMDNDHNSSAGVVFRGRVQMPDGWPPAGGQWEFVQLVTLDRYADFIVLNTIVRKQSAGNGTEMLDTSYPYAGPYNTGKDETDFHSENDNPGMGESSILCNHFRVGNERFRDWVMFDPPGAETCYVPTQVGSWGWGGDRKTLNSAWLDPTLVQSWPSNGAGVDTTDFPAWTQNAKDNLSPDEDDNNPALSLSVNSERVAHSAGVLIGWGKVEIPIAATANLTIALNSANPATLTVPATVTIPAGQTSVLFDVAVIDATSVSDIDVIIVGQSTGYDSSSTTCTVTY